MKNVENPFFSIIIPCYNSKKTIGRLLKSIANQSMSDDIEVILADDHSTESYDEEVKPFEDRLCIKRILTDYNCCPGNTREAGVSIATGKWIMFADHDDIFLPKTFREIKTEILKHNEQYVAYCNAYRAKNTDGKFNDSLVEVKIASFSVLLHGKVFNKENLWDKYDIHFKKDMFTHEDTYVVTIVKCILEHLKRKPLHIDLYSYVWFNNSESLSNTGGIRNFLEEHFHYYIEATSDVYREYYSRGFIDDNYAAYSLILMIITEYFFMQMFIFRNPEGYINSNVNVCRDDLVKLKKMFGLKNNAIFWYAGQNNARLWREAIADAGVGFVPHHSLIEWLNILDKDE